MNTDVLITVLSWEERYILGLEKIVSESNPSKVVLFKYSNPLTADWKKSNLARTKELLNDKLEEVEIDAAKPSENWFVFKNVFSKFCAQKNVLIDISTMPREAIWLSLYNCKMGKSHCRYMYHRPKSYSADWISRDPGKPRLLYKMSGIAKLGAPTLLLITGGYDIQRLDSLIYNFEPKKTMLFFQNGNDHRNKENFKDCQDIFRAKYNINLLYDYDAYDVESSFKIILKTLSQNTDDNSGAYIDDYNIIFNSLGAKTSAITLFKIWLQFPQVALSYIPSKEYNREYSVGIGDAYKGEIHF